MLGFKDQNASISTVVESPIRQHSTELETCQLMCIRANMMVDTVRWSSRRHANMRVTTVLSSRRVGRPNMMVDAACWSSRRPANMRVAI